MKIILLLAGLVLLPGISIAKETGPQLGVTRTSRNEGNTRVGFSVSCSSFVWTVIVASEPARRALVAQSLPTMTYDVCIGTIAVNVGTTTVNDSTPCADATPGYELSPNSSVSDYGEGPITCRARSLNGAPEIIKGAYYYDSNDYQR